MRACCFTGAVFLCFFFAQRSPIQRHRVLYSGNHTSYVTINLHYCSFHVFMLYFRGRIVLPRVNMWPIRGFLAFLGLFVSLPYSPWLVKSVYLFLAFRWHQMQLEESYLSRGFNLHYFSPWKVLVLLCKCYLPSQNLPVTDQIELNLILLIASI